MRKSNICRLLNVLHDFASKNAKQVVLASDHFERETTMSKSLNTFKSPTHEEIAACARCIYETEGRPEGKALEHWLQAEAQLIAAQKARATEFVAKPVPAPAKSTSVARPRVSKRSRSSLPISTRPREVVGQH
jgi:Protein of unknown function (DUF2934)